MAAMDFPSSPTNGQVYGNYVYSTAKGAWQASPTPQSVAVSSPTAPSNPKNDTLWYNTQDGNTYIYFYDGNTSQWVQIKSDATLSSTLGNRVTALETYPSGLVPVVPTSVNVSSGTATTSAIGTVSFSGTVNLDLVGVFSSAFRDYRIVINGANQSSTGAYLGFRFLVNGVQHSALNHYQSGRTDDYTGTSSAYYLNGADHIDLGGLGVSSYPQFSDGTVEVYSPNINRKKKLLAFMSGGASGVQQYVMTGQVDTAITSNGFRLYASSGTMSGTVQVYGYR